MLFLVFLSGIILECYVTIGIWNSLLSNIRGLLGGVDSLSALCKSLKSPVPIFIGIPMMMHSETPGEGKKKQKQKYIEHPNSKDLQNP